MVLDVVGQLVIVINPCVFKVLLTLSEYKVEFIAPHNKVFKEGEAFPFVSEGKSSAGGEMRERRPWRSMTKSDEEKMGGREKGYKKHKESE